MKTEFKNLDCLVLDAEMQCSLPVMKSLRKQGFRVTAGSYKKINMGFWSRFPNRRIIYPSPEFFPDEYLERILALTKEHRYAFILPLDDFSCGILAEHKTAFEPYTRIPIVPYEIFMKGRDKAETMKMAREHNIPCPITHFPDEEKIEDIAKEVTYPVLVKPNIGTGARGISLVQKKEELESTYLKVKAVYGECHIQEHIPHGGLQYKADFFLDDKQDLKAGIVYSKLRYFPIHGGSSVMNRTVWKPDIMENAVKLLKAMKWYGFADFDFITDPRDGISKIMEINPRLPNTFRIGLDAGIDFPTMIVKLAMGEKIPEFRDYQLDVYLRYLALDVLWFLKSSDRFKAEPSFFKIFGKNLHDQIISLTDPGPILGFCLEKLLVFFDREARKARYSSGW